MPMPLSSHRPPNYVLRGSAEHAHNFLHGENRQPPIRFIEGPIGPFRPQLDLAVAQFDRVVVRAHSDANVELDHGLNLGRRFSAALRSLITSRASSTRSSAVDRLG